MKAIIWVITIMLMLVIGIFGFGASVELMFALTGCLILVLFVLFFISSQMPESNKFFTWIYHLFER